MPAVRPAVQDLLRSMAGSMGQPRPCWVVSSTGAYGVVAPIGVGNYHRLVATVRAATLDEAVSTGLVDLGSEETVPEYEGGRGPQWRWDDDRQGRPATLTVAGTSALYAR